MLASFIIILLYFAIIIILLKITICELGTLMKYCLNNKKIIINYKHSATGNSIA